MSGYITSYLFNLPAYVAKGTDECFGDIRSYALVAIQFALATVVQNFGTFLHIWSITQFEFFFTNTITSG